MQPLRLFSLFCLLCLSLSVYGQPEGSRLIIFGVDGLNTYRFDEAETPHFDYMKANGSWTFQAQANEPLSSSPNWKSILTGTTPDVHRVMKNGFDKDVYRNDPSCEGEPDRFPTMFTLVKQRNPKAKTGFFHHWTFFRKLLKDDKVNKHFWWILGPKPNVKRALKFYKRKDPELVFIHIDQCDHAGHKHGHESAEYVEAVEKADKLLGMTIKAIEKEDGFSKTYLIVVSDHGGKGHGHGSGTPEGMTIPWLIMGPGIQKGHEIQAPVKNEDTAMMAMKVLGIPPHPCWTAKEIPEVFGD